MCGKRVYLRSCLLVSEGWEQMENPDSPAGHPGDRCVIDMETAAHSRHTIFCINIQINLERKLANRQTAETLCGEGGLSPCLYLSPPLAPYLEKQTQGRPLVPWVPGQPGGRRCATFLGASISKTISFSFSKNSVLKGSRWPFVI